MASPRAVREANATTRSKRAHHKRRNNKDNFTKGISAILDASSLRAGRKAESRSICVLRFALEPAHSHPFEELDGGIHENFAAAGLNARIDDLVAPFAKRFSGRHVPERF